MSEESKPLPSVEEVYYKKYFNQELSEEEKEVAKEGNIQVSFDIIIELAKHYGELCIRKALELASDRIRLEIIDRMDAEDVADIDVEDGKLIQRSIISLKDDERLKVR